MRPVLMPGATWRLRATCFREMDNRHLATAEQRLDPVSGELGSMRGSAPTDMTPRSFPSYDDSTRVSTDSGFNQ